MKIIGLFLLVLKYSFVQYIMKNFTLSYIQLSSLYQQFFTLLMLIDKIQAFS